MCLLRVPPLIALESPLASSLAMLKPVYGVLTNTEATLPPSSALLAIPLYHRKKLMSKDVNELIRLATTANDPRSKLLFDALQRRARIIVNYDFEPIASLFKYSAALLSFSRSRRDWWKKYQYHPINRYARRRRLLSGLLPYKDDCDALLMWGSWFNPVTAEPRGGLPFWMYIDQSCSPNIDKDDISGHRSLKAKRAFNVYQNQTYHDAHGIFCMSNWAREQTLAVHKLPASKVHYVGWGPHGTDLRSEKIPLNAKEPVVLFVGNDFYRKGVDILAAACWIVSERLPHVKFYVVGGNSHKLRVPAHPNLIFTGLVKDKEELANLFRKTTVFCLPARFDRSPHVLVEAMSAGKPVVATNVGGIGDAVIHSKTGLLVERENKDDLARALLLILENPETAREMGQAGKQVMLENFTWDIVAERMLATIRREQRLGKFSDGRVSTGDL